MNGRFRGATERQGRVRCRGLWRRRPDAELEILRGELGRLLIEHSREQATYRFGDSIEAVEDDGDKVAVRFTSGAARRSTW